jgi:hypothetical protein
MVRKPFFNAFSILAVMFVLNGFLLAQGTTSRLTGTVTDNSGAAVAGATVTLTNEGTGTSISMETSESGSYTFDLIQPGTYSVSVERQGFKKFVSTGNTVSVNLPATVNVGLEVGGLNETVTVEGSAEIVQTSTSGNVGSTIEQRTLEALPVVSLRGRNPLDLINFQPGVTFGSNTGGGIHVHGSRDRAFNFTLDGIDINESSAGGANFTPIRANPDSLQEMQFVTSNFTAELGRSSGAQVSLITKSGTNEFRGNAFEFYQTPEFIANEWENNAVGTPKRQFVQHIFGGSLGGPIIKNRFFFFTNLQMLRASESRQVSSTVYTQLARQGIFRYIVGGRNAPAGTSPSTANPAGASVDAAGNPLYAACNGTPPTNAPCIATYNIGANSPITIDPRLQGVINAMPLPNDYISGGDGLNTARITFNAPQREKQYDFVSKFDFKIAENNQIYVRYAQGNQDTFGDFGNDGWRLFPDSPDQVNTFRRPRNLAINHRWSPTANLTNEFVFGLNRFSFDFATPTPNEDFPYAFNTIATPETNFAYNARRVRTYQFVDNLTYVLKSHLLKGGINFRFGRQVDDRSGAGGQIEPRIGFGSGSSDFTGYNLPTAGSTSINSADRTTLQGTINNFIGRIGSISQGFVSDPSNPSQFAPAGTRYNEVADYPEYDFYVQDTWKARQNLTLDLGLRWEFKLAPTTQLRPVLRPNQPITAGSAPTNTLRFEEGELFPNDLNNVSPSIGFAWDPFSDGKTSIRANYRLSYDKFPSQLFAANIFQSAPGNTTTGTVQGIASQNRLLRNGIPNVTPTRTPDELRQPIPFSTNSIVLIDPELQFPESHQWFVGLQREIWFNNVLEVNYIGRKGKHLFGGYDANQVNIFASDPRCNQNFLQAFNAIRAGSTNECLTNLLFTGNIGSPTNNTGTTAFRNITAVSSALSTTNTGGGVAAAAAAVSQNSNSSGQQIIGLSTGFNNPFFFQPFPQFSGALNVLDSKDYSNYHGLEVIMKRRLTSGIGYQVSYTWSVSKDTRSFDPTFTLVSRGNAQSASSTPFDINNRDLNYSWSDFDRRHVVQATFVADLPFGRGRAFGSDIPKALDYVIGGWQLSGTFFYGSGRPFTVYSGLNTFSNAVQSTANCNNCPRDLGRLVQENGLNYWFTPEQRAMFTQPAPGELGNTPRNYFIGPSRNSINASLSKKFKFSERYSFDLRVDASNLPNIPSFGLPTATVSSTSFGQIGNSVLSFSRRLQLSGKFNF